MSLLKKKSQAQEPTPSRFDLWDSGMLFDVLETCLGSTGPLLQAYRTFPERREETLAILEIELRQAHEALQSLRSRL